MWTPEFFRVVPADAVEDIQLTREEVAHRAAVVAGKLSTEPLSAKIIFGLHDAGQALEQRRRDRDQALKSHRAQVPAAVYQRLSTELAVLVTQHGIPLIEGTANFLRRKGGAPLRIATQWEGSGTLATTVNLPVRATRQRPTAHFMSWQDVQTEPTCWAYDARVASVQGHVYAENKLPDDVYELSGTPLFHIDLCKSGVALTGYYGKDAESASLTAGPERVAGVLNFVGQFATILAADAALR